MMPAEAGPGRWRSHLSWEDRRKIMLEAIRTYGHDRQVAKAVEEAAELIVAIQRFRENRCALADLVDKIADVRIMLEQLEMMMDVPVLPAIDRKLERLYARLQEVETTEEQS